MGAPQDVHFIWATRAPAFLLTNFFLMGRLPTGTSGLIGGGTTGLVFVALPEPELSDFVSLIRNCDTMSVLPHCGHLFTPFLKVSGSMAFPQYKHFGPSSLELIYSILKLMHQTIPSILRLLSDGQV
jgi:hypothetical protein